MTNSRVSKALDLLVQYAGWVCVLPIPLWLVFQIVVQPEAAWRAHYVSANPAEPSITRFEQALSHYWTGNKEAIDFAPVSPERLAITFDTCLSADETVEVPIMLVASGSARLLVDGQPLLEIADNGEHTTRGVRWAIAPGAHHVRVEFKGSTRPVIGLLASFDGQPPRPVASGDVAPAVTTFRPNEKSNSCQR